MMGVLFTFVRIKSSCNSCQHGTFILNHTCTRTIKSSFIMNSISTQVFSYNIFLFVLIFNFFPGQNQQTKKLYHSATKSQLLCDQKSLIEKGSFPNNQLKYCIILVLLSNTCQNDLRIVAYGKKLSVTVRLDLVFPVSVTIIPTFSQASGIYRTKSTQMARFSQELLLS